ncbi:MAG: hypothetical protein IKV44_07030 [Clostridia bacterium]|nr:hypothetical protein [Clostridia bacterium]
MNYKKMYHELFNATEKAINILIEAQQKCEDIYVDEFNCDIVELFEEKETHSDD